MIINRIEKCKDCERCPLVTKGCGVFWAMAAKEKDPIKKANWLRIAEEDDEINQVQHL
jgi:hypothetical protein